MVTSSHISTVDNDLDEVIAVVSDHWLRGSMTTTGNRVLDILNEGNTDYLRLSDARVFATSDLKTPITTLVEVMVPKDKLAVVFIPANNNHDVDYKKYYSKVQTRRLAGFALVCGHAVQGSIHLKTRLTDPIFALNHALTRYFPMTQANVSLPSGGSMPVTVAIVNMQFVDCFHLGDPEVSNDEPAAVQKPKQQSSIMDDPLIRGLIDAAAGHPDIEADESIRADA